jgi:hypothetical protein
MWRGEQANPDQVSDLVWEWNTFKRNGVNPNEFADESGVHSEDNAFDYGL